MGNFNKINGNHKEYYRINYEYKVPENNSIKKIVRDSSKQALLKEEQKISVDDLNNTLEYILNKETPIKDKKILACLIFSTAAILIFLMMIVSFFPYAIWNFLIIPHFSILPKIPFLVFFLIMTIIQLISTYHKNIS